MPKRKPWEQYKEFPDSEGNKLKLQDEIKTINNDERNEGTRKNNPKLIFMEEGKRGKITHLGGTVEPSALVIFDEDPKKRKMSCFTKNLLKL